MIDDVKKKGVMSQLVKRLGDIETIIRKIIASGALSRALYPLFSENTPQTLFAHTHDYDPGPYGVLLMSSNANWNLTGITSGVQGRELRIINIGVNNIVIAHQNTGSVAAYRILSPSGANITLLPDDAITLYYDSTTLRWRVVALAQ